MRAPLERLSVILRALEEASKDRTRVEALLAVLAAEPFEGAALFVASQDGHSFMLTASRGLDARTLRQWKRWPLRRLFIRMKPARILDPTGSGRFALAAPLVHGKQSYVVIAPVREAMLSPTNEAFFAALESITIPLADELGADTGDATIAPVEPIILGLSLCASLDRRLSLVLRSRGWSLSPFSSTRRIFERLVSSDADVVVVDVDELTDPVATLQLLNRVRSPLQIVAFVSEPRTEMVGKALADCVVFHDTDDARLLGVLKRIVRTIAVRRTRTREIAARAGAEVLHTIRQPEELARFAAVRAAEIAHGWAGVALVSEAGTVHFAEYPRREARILSKIPPGFLRDGPLLQFRVDGRLMEEISDDPAARADLAALLPLSGALLPIDGQRRIGVLAALSLARQADSGVFEALVELARSVGRRYQELSDRRAAIPEFAHEGLWERWLDRKLEVAVYRSRDCTIPSRYQALSATRGLLTLGKIDVARLHRRLGTSGEPDADEVTGALAQSIAGPQQFAAVLDADAKSIVYAARDFSPPLVLEAVGPSGIIAAGQRLTTGIATLGATTEAVVCDHRMWRWFGESRSRLRALPSVLDELGPPGLASLIRLSS